MREVQDSDSWALSVAKTVATRSKDPNTQVGCVITNEDYDILATGYNSFARGAQENEELWKRPAKYIRVIHAETVAIGKAAKLGHSIDGGRLYTTHFPCETCTKLIIAAGIKTVIALQEIPGWEEEHYKAQNLMIEAKITYCVESSGVYSPSYLTEYEVNT